MALRSGPIGEVIRRFRIDGCRLFGHDIQTSVMAIAETGLVKIGAASPEPLQAVRAESTNQQKG